ncbi:zinc finger protein 91-like [Sitophilus oryzae]|uniref:Zinc finger protein 91-like n=1 Tax=Sitophilus oryzae TaxID=7048 RepID=A0A6J2YBB6_SITOR|nr:zinc finger protein 91-like [Sitophilus oryzae]
MDVSSVKSELVEEYQHAVNGQQIEFIDNERNNESKNYQCEDCSEEFQAIELYEMHKNIHYIHRRVKKCPTCKRSYKLKNGFQKHIESHLNNYLKCTFCPKILFMKKLYTKHISWHKKFEKCYECSFCNKAFSDQKQLTIHERVHTNERPFECNICNKTFKQNSSLYTHMNTHMEEKKYICQICQGRFATSSSVNRHIKTVHENGVSFSCRLCELEFYNRFSYQEHRKKQHPNLKNYFRTCPVCSEQFNTKWSYLKHKKMHESRGEIQVVRAVRMSGKSDKNFRKCLLCGILVDRKSYYFHLNKHLNMTDDEVKDCERISLFPCKECEYVFLSREKAIRHMGIHLEKSFVCEKKDCDIKTAMTYMSYTVHNRKFHEKFICQLCKVIFVGHAKYEKHRKKYCKTKKNKDVVACKWCKLNFTSSQRLLTHYCHYKKCYSAYQCSACSKSFSLLISLKKHILLSHKSKKVSNHVERGKFKCKHCGDLFDFSNQLIRHERRCLSYMQCGKCNKTFTLLKFYILHVENEMCSVDPSKLFCTPCNRILSSVQAFKKHMRTVHAKTGVPCRYCNQFLKNNESLRKHMVRKHPNNEKYFCKFCELGFVKYQQLLFHRKSDLCENNANVEQIAKAQDTS